MEDTIREEVRRIIGQSSSVEEVKNSLEALGLQVHVVVHIAPKDLNFETYLKLKEHNPPTLRTGVPLSIMYVSPMGPDVL